MGAEKLANASNPLDRQTRISLEPNSIASRKENAGELASPSRIGRRGTLRHGSSALHSGRLHLSIIGCVVNGPGEALMTDVGFTGGGAGSGMVYLAGKASHKMSNDQMIEHIVEEVEKRAAEIEAGEAERPAAE